MCFSPEMDAVTGTAVVVVGVDAWRHLRGRTDHLLLAALPLLLGAHQLIEDFVWWGLQGHVPATVGRIAMYAYLVIAFVVLPVFVPLAIVAIEPTGRRMLRVAPFIALGAVVSTVLLYALIRGPVSASLAPWHLAYGIQLDNGLIVVALYVVAICGATLFSGYRHVVVFGLANLVVVGVLATLTLDGFASLWCVWAAVTAGAIALHMRYAKPHRAMPYALT